MADYDADVIIAGGGPIGVGLAIDLAIRGISTIVVERYTQIQRIPKGQNMTQRTGEHFKAWGVGAQIREATPIPPEFGNSGLTAYGSLFSGYHYDWFRRASVREYYAADNERAPQYETERVLRERASQFPEIELITGWTVESVDQHGDRVVIGARKRNPDTDSNQVTRELTGKYVVGCDGSGSFVREAGGITQTVDSRNLRMALLVFNSVELDRKLDVFPGKTIFNTLHPRLKGYWQFLGRVDLESNWFFHAPVPENTARDNFDFEVFLHNAIGEKFAVRFDHIGFWDLRFSQADDYRNGRVFVAGDAAHSHPPYGGYGINTGFEDARNLSWKLAAVISERAGDALLDTYSTERHPVFASTRDDFIARMIADDDAFTARYDPAVDQAAFEAAWQQRADEGDPAVGRFLPNYAGSPIVWGEAGATSGAVGRHEHRAQAGFHLCPQPISDGRDVYDALGDEFTLIAVDAGDDDIAQFELAARKLNVGLTVLRSTLTEQTQRWQARLILVRPDQFIAFAGDTVTTSGLELLNRCVAGKSSGISGHDA